MGIPRNWLIGGSCSAIVFTIWGIFGWGRAVTLFPQNEKQVAIVQEEDLPLGTGESKLLYDASTYRRAKPLKDPFQMEGIAKVSSERKQGNGTTVLTPIASNEKKKEIATSKNASPGDLHLQGILSYEGRAKAMISWNGETVTVGEGEGVGSWIITSIKAKEVILKRNGETRILSMQ